MLFHILNERVILQFWLVLSNKKHGIDADLFLFDKY